MRTDLMLALAIVAAVPSLSPAEWKPPQQRDQMRAVATAVADEDIPSKWFQDAKGHEKALEAQKLTGADMFIYFVRPNTGDEKGLCSWFESKGVNSLPVRQLLREYVKVRVALPGNPKNEDLAKKFDVKKTPAVFVVQPNGWRNRIKAFNWDERPLKLLEPEELANAIRLNSSEKYRPAEVTPDPAAPAAE